MQIARNCSRSRRLLADLGAAAPTRRGPANRSIVLAAIIVWTLPCRPLRCYSRTILGRPWTSSKTRLKVLKGFSHRLDGLSRMLLVSCTQLN